MPHSAQRSSGRSRDTCANVSALLRVDGQQAAGIAYRQPDDLVRVHGIAGAAGVLLVAGAVDDNRVVEGSCALNLCQIPDRHGTCGGTEGGHAPFREASMGLMSKMSMPCIFPMSSRRSRPVACSTSVGMVPGFAPGGMRSSSFLISVDGEEYQHKSSTWIGLVVVVAAAISVMSYDVPECANPAIPRNRDKTTAIDKLENPSIDHSRIRHKLYTSRKGDPPSKERSLGTSLTSYFDGLLPAEKPRISRRA